MYCAMLNCSCTRFYLDVFFCVSVSGKNHGSVLLSSGFISLMGKRSFIFRENVEFSGMQKLAYQNVTRRKSLLFLCMFFSCIAFSSTSTFLAWAILYLWENIITWTSQFKFTAGPKENYQKRTSFPAYSSSSLWRLEDHVQTPSLHLTGSAW